MTGTLVIQDFHCLSDTSKNIPLDWSWSLQFPAPGMKTAMDIKTGKLQISRTKTRKPDLKNSLN